MPPKKEPPLEIPPLPTGYWKAQEVEALPLDLLNPKVMQFSNKPNGKFPGDFLVYCALLRVPPHPCIQKVENVPIEQQDNGSDSIELRNVLFDSRSVALLMLSLKPVKAIQSLTFFNAGLSPASCRTLGEGLPLTSLIHLQLDYNPLDEGDEATQAFLRSLTAPTSRLVTLSLRGNGLKDGAVGLLCENLSSNMAIQALNLFDNRISDVGGAKLAEAVKMAGNNSQLGSISLANNQLTKAAAIAWADVFGSGRGEGLQLLNLSSNKIDFEGLQHLLTVLASNKARLQNFKSIALHRNQINASESFWAPLLKEIHPIRCTL